MPHRYPTRRSSELGFAEYTPSRSTAEFAIISRSSGPFPPLTLDFTGLGETSGYIKTDGAQTTTSRWVSTDFLELPVGMEITCHLFGHTVVRSEIGSASCRERVCQYV